MSDYPEHAKLHAKALEGTQVHDLSQAIGQFLDWLPTEGIHLMHWTTFEEPKECFFCDGTGKRANWPEENCKRCGGTGYGKGVTKIERWANERRTISELLAAYFEIDQDKIEAEKRAMLDSLRAAGREAAS